MKRILTLLLFFISIISFAQTTWVKWNGHLFLKIGNDSTHFGEDYWSTMPGIVAAINAKQDTLIPGSSIKTIKGESLLGSGNIPIAWGDLTGTLTNQSDLQTAFNGKLSTNGNGSSLTGLTKTQVGLSNVDNISDANKPISSATQTALNAKLATNGDGSSLTNLTKTQVGLGNVDNTSDANKPISSATQTALNGKQATLVSGTNIKTINSTDITGSGNVVIAGVNSTITFLPSDVINNNASANTIADVTGLSFAVLANVTYRFKFYIVYSASATTTGSRWSINGPATTFMHYRSTYTLTAASETVNSGVAAYNTPSGVNASSLATGNIAIIEGIIRPSAGGTVIGRFASEISSSAITAVASGRSYVEYQIIN